jgi:Skp family chaperone for outer membrane proteins
MRSISLVAASLLTFTAAPLSAQTFGPPIPGMCLLSRASAISGSQVNQSLQSQLQQLRSQLSGDLSNRRTAIDQQIRALEAGRNTIAPVEYERQKAELERQAQLLDQQQNSAFIAAQTQGQQQIDNVVNQALSRVITSRGCSVVLERDGAYGWNNAMDITESVAREMDSIAATVRIR